MSTNSTSTSGGKNTDTSGSGEGAGNETYSKEFVEKLRKEKENQAKGLSELREQNKKLQEQLDSLQNQELTEQNKFKELFEKEKQKSSELSSKYVSLQERIANSTKRDALRSELNKFGLEDKFFEDCVRLIDLKTVTVDPETSVVVGAEDAAKSFFEKYKSLGFFKGTTTTANHNGIKNGANGAGPGKTSGLDISKMSQKEKMEALRAHHRK